MCPTQKDAQWPKTTDISVLQSVIRSCACAIGACLLARLLPSSGGIQRQFIASYDAISSMMRTPSTVVISDVRHTGKLLRAGFSATFCNLHRLAIDHSSTGYGFAFFDFRQVHDQHCVDHFEQAGIARRVKVAWHRRHRRKAVGQKSPRAAARGNIEYRV